MPVKGDRLFCVIVVLSSKEERSIKMPDMVASERGRGGGVVEGGLVNFNQGGYCTVRNRPAGGGGRGRIYDMPADGGKKFPYLI